MKTSIIKFYLFMTTFAAYLIELYRSWTILTIFLRNGIRRYPFDTGVTVSARNSAIYRGQKIKRAIETWNDKLDYM